METTGPLIKSGVTTSEYEVVQKNSTMATILMVVGAVMAIAPEIIEKLQAVDGIAQSRPGMIAITILGGLITLASIISKALGSAAYINGRSLVKAAAARDVPPPPMV